ncbi:MAG: tetratricopeptide repeat protein [Planctomycetota bacterium]|nr:tetratricopeptide repeat protein [Planctomycetota bacterium]
MDPIRSECCQNSRPYRVDPGVKRFGGYRCVQFVFGIGFGVLASLIVDTQQVAAQSIRAPSEPIKLFPPKGAPEAIPQRVIPPQRWSQIPAEGIVLDPGAHEALDAADPASPFQSSGSGKSPVASRFGSKIPGGLPDREISEGKPLRSELVSDSGSALIEQETLEGMGDPDDEQEGVEGGLRSSQKKANRQRQMQQHRLVGSFPRDFLLDATDPGLFQFMNDQWIPSRAANGKEAQTRFEVNANAAWEELRPQLLARLQACDALLRKGSIYSARDEIRMGLSSLARKLDQLSGPSHAAGGQRKTAIRKSMPHESALQHALREIDECSYAKASDLPTALQTFSDLVPQATLNHPWAADFWYAMGKTYEREMEYAPKQPDILRLQSVECYKVALRMAPSRGYIANQLGYSYLHTGSLEDASKALKQALDAGPTPYSWRNLAELYRLRGSMREARLADEQAEFLLTERAKP